VRKKVVGKPKRKKSADVVRLEDLAPRKAVTGGSSRILFGEQVEGVKEEPPTPEGTRESKGQ
jgi:hypothetical protein